ncbi:MAG: hypothetical protein Q8Q32_01540 [bacterium]|nr:hypothetical protein [bacterium]
MLTLPKNDSRFSWTTHIKSKMMFYHISGAQINRIFRHPDRVEEGIAPNTVAAMKTRKKGGNKKGSEEIWIMYQMNKKPSSKNLKSNRLKSSRITMISAWRYPGKTKAGERPKIPEGLLDELKMEGLI